MSVWRQSIARHPVAHAGGSEVSTDSDCRFLDATTSVVVVGVRADLFYCDGLEWVWTFSVVSKFILYESIPSIAKKTNVIRSSVL